MSSEAGPGSPGEPSGGAPAERPVTLTDPTVMRALAHPVRMALLDIITVAGTLTATQAGEALGESPANCAFHLRTLAKYGFVREAGGGRGRERPWELVPVQVSISSRQQDPRASAAAEILGQAWNERWLERARRHLNREENPPGWEQAPGTTHSLEFMTPGELIAMREEVWGVMSRYRGRHHPGAPRPPSALPVELTFISYPLADLADLAGPPACEPGEPDGPGPVADDG